MIELIVFLAGLWIGGTVVGSVIVARSRTAYDRGKRDTLAAVYRRRDN